MAEQLRRYRIQAGRASQFAKEWRDGVAPLRSSLGFRVQGWLVYGSDEFVWVIGHDGDRSAFETAERVYYTSPARQSLEPDPARLVEEARSDWIDRFA